MKFLSQINVNTEYTLPIVDGSNGQVLTTDGDGAVYWGSVSAGATNLNALTDVIITSPQVDQILAYRIPLGESIPVWMNITSPYAPLASPALTGVPTAPTASTATNSTQIATTAFVKNQGYLTSYTETDTLATVTTRGNTTTNTITVGGATSNYLLLVGESSLLDTKGILKWGTDHNSVEIYYADGKHFDVGQAQMWYVKNGHEAPITKGTIVMATGAVGNSGNIEVSPLIADGSVSGKFALGVMMDDVEVGGFAYAMTEGTIRGIDTSIYTLGTVLWADPAIPGGFTSTEPTAPNLKLPIAFVVSSANNGAIGVRMSQGLDLHEVHDVTISSASNGQLLRYNGGIWENWSPNYLTTFTETDPTVPAHVKSITETEKSQWTAAYNDSIRTAAVTGTGTKTLTLTQQDGGTVTATWTDYDTDTDAQTLTWEAETKTLGISGGNDITLDGLATEEFVTGQGYITGYTESDTLATVTARGATTSGAIYINGDLNFTPADGIGINAKESMIFTIDSDNNDTGRIFQFREGSGNTLMVIQEAGNVGIGTTSPNSKLDVVAADNAIISVRQSNAPGASKYAQIVLTHGTTYFGANDKSYQLVSNSLGTGEADFAIQYWNGTSYNERMRVTSAGNVGIGITSPSEKLHVAGSIKASGGLYSDNGALAGNIGLGQVTSITSSFGSYANLQFTMHNGGGFSDIMKLQGNGNVGIGTTSPADKLHVEGNVTLSDSSPEITFQTGATHYNWQIAAQESVNAAFEISVGSQDADASNDTWSPKMVVLQSGNVGIGTTSPSYTLHVASADDSVVLIESNGTDATDDARLELKTTNGTFAIQNDRSLGTSGALTFAGNTSNNLVIDHNSGNVGIGTTSPTTKLDVNGVITATGGTSTNWNAAYNDKINSASFNTADGVLTLTQQDGGTVTVDLDGRYLTSETDSQNLEWDGVSKNLTITNGNTVTLDGLLTSEDLAAYGYISSESDTLATVTGRGATTTNAITVGNLRVVGGSDTFQFAQKLAKSSYADTGGHTTLIGLGCENAAWSRSAIGHTRTTSYDAGYLGFYVSNNNADATELLQSDLRMMINRDGNVGIGTTSPSEKLHVVGTILSDQGEARFKFNSTSGTGRAYDMIGGNDGKFYFYDRTATSYRYVIDASGNVGIGTTTPGSKLTVAGSAIAISNGWTGAHDILFVGGSPNSTGGASSTAARIRSTASAPGGAATGDLMFTVNRGDSFVDAIYINPDGNVGVGTTSPIAKLHISSSGTPLAAAIQGDSKLVVSGVDGNMDLLSLDDNSTVANSIGFGRFNSSTGALIHKFGITAWANTGSTGSNTGDRIAFNYGTLADAWSNSELMTIKSNGYVGIGTTNPANRLQIGSIGSSGYGGNDIVMGNGTQVMAFFQSSTASTWYTNNNFALMPAGVGAIGNVGIGTDSPSTRLHVSGVITATGGNSTNWNSAYSWGNHADAEYIKANSTEPLTIQAETVTFTGSVTVEGTFTESSSIRFKENIEPLPQSLEAVNALNPVSYNKVGADDREIGLIAEEVAELFPEVVTYNEEGQPQGVQYQRLSVILLKAVQELTERVNKLENK